ncbi:hypothetical protein Tco_1421401, partial [Tanacetum coccineum]
RPVVTEDCLSWSDRVVVAVLVQRLVWLEKSLIEDSRVPAELHLQSSISYLLDSVVFPL